MAAGTNSERQILSLRKIENSRDVGGAGAAHDQRRTPIVCGILYETRGFIVGHLRRDDVAGNLGGEPPNRRIERSHILPAWIGDPPRSTAHFDRVPVKRSGSERRLLDELSSSS